MYSKMKTVKDQKLSIFILLIIALVQFYYLINLKRFLISRRTAIKYAQMKQMKVIYLTANYYEYKWFDHSPDPFIWFRCPFWNCRLTRNKTELRHSDALLFHSNNLDLDLADFISSRYPEQLWILYNMEPLSLQKLKWKNLDGLFNWTMSYRRDSDIAAKYGLIQYVQRRKLSNTLPKTKKNAAVWYSNDCCTSSHREDYIQVLNLYYPLKVIGNCAGNDHKPKNFYLLVERSYKFYLAFENWICEDYVTKNFFDVLKYNIIPIVYGGADYSSIAPPKSYINAMDYPDPKDLASYLWKVSENETLYNSYFEWKIHYQSVMFPWMCSLCEKLHSTNNRKSVLKRRYFKKWWIDQAGCKYWDYKKLFLPVTTNDVPCNKHLFKH